MKKDKRPTEFTVRAEWNDEQGVWYSASDIKGLAVGSVNLVEFWRGVAECMPGVLEDHYPEGTRSSEGFAIRRDRNEG